MTDVSFLLASTTLTRSAPCSRCASLPPHPSRGKAPPEVWAEGQRVVEHLPSFLGRAIEVMLERPVAPAAALRMARALWKLLDRDEDLEHRTALHRAFLEAGTTWTLTWTLGARPHAEAKKRNHSPSAERQRDQQCRNHGLRSTHR
jgi:hypothetical protein